MEGSIESFIESASKDITLQNFSYELNIYIYLYSILYDTISTIRKSYKTKNKVYLKDLIQLVVDYLLYGDKNDQAFFE